MTQGFVLSLAVNLLALLAIFSMSCMMNIRKYMYSLLSKQLHYRSTEAKPLFSNPADALLTVALA